MKKIRTRYAPSPTGKLHIGGARTALFCYLYAKHFDGDFIVRIEDTDLNRNIADGEKMQLDNLIWLGITPDESPRNPQSQYGPYRQSEKIKRYHDLIKQLLATKKAYKAYDTPEELATQKKLQVQKGIFSFRYDRSWLKISEQEKQTREQNKQYTIRLAQTPNKIYEWNDIVRGKIAFNTDDIGDWVIQKQNGYPTYNFAVVVDDHDMAISDVLRGEEHITNTPKQLAVYDAFGWEPPQFGHLTIITNEAGKKLSKRDTSIKQFISDYRQEGFWNEAIFNFLALLGWTHPQAQEILSKSELIKSFDPKRLSKSPTKFDFKKMAWFSKSYIKKIPNHVLTNLIAFTTQSPQWQDLFLSTYKQAASTIQEIQHSLKLYEDDAVIPADHPHVVKTFSQQLAQLDFTPENIAQAIKATQKITDLSGKDLFMPIRKATTYQDHGPELAKAIYLFGQQLITRRLSNDH